MSDLKKGKRGAIATATSAVENDQREAGAILKKIFRDSTTRATTSQGRSRSSSGRAAGTMPVYLLPHAPDLNPVEMQWHIIKKAAANVLYGSTDAMKTSVRGALRGRETGVAKMNHYLLG